MFWTGFAACLAGRITARFIDDEWNQWLAFIAGLSPAQRKMLSVLRRSRVIGAHSGICRLRVNLSGNAAVNPRGVAWRRGHLRSSRSIPAQARRAVPARRNRYDAAIFSAGLSRVHVDGVRRLQHAFVDAAVLNFSPPWGNAPDGEGRLVQAFSKKVHRKRSAEARFSRAALVLSMTIPQTRKPAVRC